MAAAISATSASCLPLDPIAHIGAFLNLHDVIGCSLVSQLWKQAMGSETVWFNQFDREKIPRVSGSSAYREDFKFLYPRTISAAKMTDLGEFMGEVPMMSHAEFDRYRNGNDPFKPEKKIHQTFCILVEPKSFKRVYDRDLVMELCEKGDGCQKVKKSDSSEKEALIPYSFKNTVVLVSHLKRKDDVGILSPFCKGIVNAIKLPPSSKVNISFIRRNVPKATRNLFYLGQKRLMEEMGLEAAPLTARFLFSVIEIYNKGSCPDRMRKGCWIYARVPETILRGNHQFHVNMGGYHSTKGLEMDACNEQTSTIGVAPRFKTNSLGSDSQSGEETKSGQPGHLEN